MSRLLKHKQKKALLFLALVIVGVFVIFTIGFQLIIKGSVFVANLFGDKSDLLQVENQVLSEINVNEIPTATNSSKIRISGNTYNVETLIIFLNNQEVKQIQISSKNEFNTIIDNLTDGQNEIYFIGDLKRSDKRKKSDIYTVISKTSKPKIEITSPKDRTNTPKTEIDIIGKTDTNTSVTINNQPVVVGSDGNFKYLVRLNEGENKFLITAQDEAGNTENLTLTIIYEK